MSAPAVIRPHGTGRRLARIQRRDNRAAMRLLARLIDRHDDALADELAASLRAATLAFKGDSSALGRPLSPRAAGRLTATAFIINGATLSPQEHRRLTDRLVRAFAPTP